MYDERENAEALVDAVQAALASYPHPWELVVVDDGSRDGTGAVLQRHAARIGQHVRVLRLLRNFGQSAAMQAGIDAARGDVIVTMDGDLQNDPADIPALVARLLQDDLDLVAGWRRRREDALLLRKIPSALANRLIRRTTGLEFQDLGCSLKAFRAAVLREVRLYGEMHRFIPAWLATVTSPARMAEVPVSHRGRARGQSKYGLSRTIRVLLDLLAVFFFLRFRARPGHFFGGVGLLVLAAGLSILGYLGILKVTGESIGGRPLLSLGFFCVIGGVQLLTTGVLAELLIRVYFDGRPARSYQATAQAAPAPGAGWSGGRSAGDGPAVAEEEEALRVPGQPIPAGLAAHAVLPPGNDRRRHPADHAGDPWSGSGDSSPGLGP
jgi:glycosyltransferase involved in cell wall biosynthesis